MTDQQMPDTPADDERRWAVKLSDGSWWGGYNSGPTYPDEELAKMDIRWAKNGRHPETMSLLKDAIVVEVKIVEIANA